MTCEITKALALTRNLESYLELNTKEQVLLHLAETALFSPEICAEVVWARIFNALNNLSEMKVPSDPESIRALAVKNFPIWNIWITAVPSKTAFEFLAKLDRT